MARWFADRCPRRGIPAISLRAHLPRARFLGCPDLLATGCRADSRRIEPGEVYVALEDDPEAVHRALERGAVGVIAERFDPESGPIQIVVSDARQALARIRLGLAGDPQDRLILVGVTGEHGKATTSAYLRAIWAAAGIRSGWVARADWSDGARRYPRQPGPETTAELLAELAERGCRAAVLVANPRRDDVEALEGVRLNAAAVTALDDDEFAGFDPALRLERRRSAARLVRNVDPGSAVVVNADDVEAELLGAVHVLARRVAVGVDRLKLADLRARVTHRGRDETRLHLSGLDQAVSVRLHGVGSARVRNALAAAAVAWSLETPRDAIIAGLEAVGPLPGRLERVAESVWIDRARGPAAVARALRSLRETPLSRLVCVLGSEGGRPRSERLALARVAERLAEQVVLTTDDPRDEDPQEIAEEIASGFTRRRRVLVELDRRAAIHSALELARPDDGVLILGKGRQSAQFLGERIQPFDDRAEIAAWTAQRAASRVA